MAVEEGYLAHVVSRLGLSSQVAAANLISGEIAYTQDDKTFHVGDETQDPPAVMTTKSTRAFDFTRAESVTLPGGVVFDKNSAGGVDGVTVSKLNEANGFLVRKGDDQWVSAVFRSSDNSIIVQGGSGSTGQVDLKINPNSSVVQQLFDGIGALSITSISGLQNALDTLSQLIINTKADTLTEIRGGASTTANTLKKLEDAVASSVVVIGDESGVAAQAIAIIRDGVRSDRDTLKKISDALDVNVTNIQDLSVAVGNLGGTSALDPFFIAFASTLSGNSYALLRDIDRTNKELGLYA